MSQDTKAAAQSGTPGPLSADPAKLPSRDLELVGEHVKIVGLSTDHVTDLFAAMGGQEHSGLFNFLFHGPFVTEEAMRDQIAKFQQQSGSDIAWYTIISKQTSQPVGFCALMRIDAKNRVIEVGSITYSPLLQRSASATETMYLLAKYVFEDLGYRRYEWKCDSMNKPSIRAAERLGFTYEGLFRQHMITRGRNRDTTWYSMLDHEWPDRKAAFENWLDQSNFDSEGMQKRKLQSFRES